jgi:hypothetical protein
VNVASSAASSPTFFRAQALQAIGIGEHLTGRCQFLVFPRLRRCTIDLRQLEREELRARRLLLLARGKPLPVILDLLPSPKRPRDGFTLRRQSRELVEQIEMG